jgi:hypothetical protein
MAIPGSDTNRCLIKQQPGFLHPNGYDTHPGWHQYLPLYDCLNGLENLIRTYIG